MMVNNIYWLSISPVTIPLAPCMNRISIYRCNGRFLKSARRNPDDYKKLQMNNLVKRLRLINSAITQRQTSFKSSQISMCQRQSRRRRKTLCSQRFSIFSTVKRPGMLYRVLDSAIPAQFKQIRDSAFILSNKNRLVSLKLWLRSLSQWRMCSIHS